MEGVRDGLATGEASGVWRGVLADGAADVVWAFVGLFIGGGAEFGVCAARGRQLCFWRF